MTKAERIQSQGEVFTRPEAVSFMLDQIGIKSNENLANINILEPAAGDGAFAIEIVKRVIISAEHFNFDLNRALQNLWFVEINNKNIARLTQRLKENAGLCEEQIAKINLINADFLKLDVPRKFEVIIGNPPYVRWDNIDEKTKVDIHVKFATFRGRCDLYVAFFEKCLHLLDEKGVLNFLCSNRWFRAAYGKQLRKLVQSRFALEVVIDLESTNPFTEDVLGYPAITLIRNCDYHITRYRKVNQLQDLWLSATNYSDFDLNKSDSDVWTFETTYEGLDQTPYYGRIETCGYTVKIGIATGKDSVFIGSDLAEKVEREVLVPLLKAKDLKKVPIRSNLLVINCFDKSGKLRNLDKYPRLDAYLSKHKDVLKNRYVARKKPSAWFRTIDKIRVNDIEAEKILLPDISGSNRIFVGGAGYYPHHNLYYILSRSPEPHLKVLAAILSSSFIKRQLLLLSNQMNGGYPRWQSQNIRRLVIPNVVAMSERWKSEMVAAYTKHDLAQIDKLMENSVIEREYEAPTSWLLFDPSPTYTSGEPSS